MEAELYRVRRFFLSKSLVWAMWGRALWFLLSLGFVSAALVVGGWLIAAGEVRSFDGLFLFCTCLVIAFAFGLCLRWLLRTAVSEAQSASAPCDCGASCEEEHIRCRDDRCFATYALSCWIS